jgi:phosphoglycolate phosphatase-like HAD superfamily hydrolase
VKVPPSEAIMLGDTPYDVIAAKRAGIEIVGVESGGWTR